MSPRGDCQQGRAPIADRLAARQTHGGQKRLLLAIAGVVVVIDESVDGPPDCVRMSVSDCFEIAHRTVLRAGNS